MTTLPLSDVRLRMAGRTAIARIRDKLEGLRGDELAAFVAALQRLSGDDDQPKAQVVRLHAPHH